MKYHKCPHTNDYSSLSNRIQGHSYYFSRFLFPGSPYLRQDDYQKFQNMRLIEAWKFKTIENCCKSWYKNIKHW